jgi:hypothetical protein
VPLLDVAVKVPWCCESDGFPPPLMQTTVAEYVALNDAVALVLPTPASVNPVHVGALPETEQLAVPDLKCVPVGAFAGLIVVLDVAAATAGNATAAATTIATVRNLFMDRSPLSIWGSDFLLPVTVAARPQE